MSGSYITDKYEIINLIEVYRANPICSIHIKDNINSPLSFDKDWYYEIRATDDDQCIIDFKHSSYIILSALPIDHNLNPTLCLNVTKIDSLYKTKQVDTEPLPLRQILGLEKDAKSTSKSVRKRPSKDEYYLGIAKAVSKRSTCLRRQYGAVLVKDDEIISTGYNGSARGETNCLEVGTCPRIENNIPQGERYEECVAIHAEQNAIISAARKDTVGSTLYLYGEDSTTDEEISAWPCKICMRMIKNAGIKKIVSVSKIDTLYRE